MWEISDAAKAFLKLDPPPNQMDIFNLTDAEFHTKYGVTPDSDLAGDIDDLLPPSRPMVDVACPILEEETFREDPDIECSACGEPGFSSSEGTRCNECGGVME